MAQKAELSRYDAFVIAINDTYDAAGTVRDTGPSSGWILDNRGGFPRTTVCDGYNILNDVSDTAGTALIRPINHIKHGLITLETSLNTSGDGVSLEYRDDNDKPVYELKLIDGCWCILGKDGNYIAVTQRVFSQTKTTFKFKLVLDLDALESSTYIDDCFCGTHPLLAGSIESFRFATDKVHKLVVTPGAFLMYANYRIFDNFEKLRPLPVYGWTTGDGVSVCFNEMWIESDKAQRAFFPIDGDVCFKCHFKNKNAKKTSISLCSHDKKIIEVTYESNTLFANGKQLYKCRFSDMWHRLCLECDTNQGTVNVLLNGQRKGTVTIQKGVSFDSAAFESSEGMSNFDFIKLYNTVEHSDYVPEPLCRAKLDDYIAAMNICSMWVNGNHFGWGCISPFKEHEPYLGFYDEGSPETADWEIKYLVERGIDYQNFCWYGGFENGYLKNPRLSDQLHEGYQYARYSDRMYYTIMWETWGKIASLEQFKNIIVPYWFENYFLDERYLKIDNKIVCCIYAPQSLMMNNLFGSLEGAQQALAYLEDMAKSFGFDGMLFVESGVYNNKSEAQIPVKAMGFDASVCYHWFGNGYLPDHNIGNISIAEIRKQTHFIPTPSSGYDGYVWRKKTEDPVRRPVANYEDMYKVCKWIKDDYLPKYESSPQTWKKKMIMFSTWNEYGEGTFIMPCGINGFGQLNAINEAFPNGDKKEDIIPTPSQRERINRLYPQKLTLLRRYGYYVKQSIIDNQQSIIASYSPAEARDGAVFYRHSGGGFDFNLASTLEISLKGKIGSKVRISFTDSKELYFSPSKSFTVTIDSDEEKIYSVNTRENYRFSSCLLALKVELIDGTLEQASAFVTGDITIRSFIGNGVAAKTSSLMINGITVESDIYPEKSGEKIYFPFDPDTAVDYLINSFTTWDRYTEMLTISANDHTAVYRMGSDRYVLDGVEKDLGYVLYKTDGIPMMDFEKLSLDFGFEHVWEGEVLKIKAPQSCSIDPSELSDHSFTFRHNLLHGWSSPHMAFIPGESSMKAITVLSTTDPQMYRHGTSFKAEENTRLLIRVKYKYNCPAPNYMEIFFDTNKAKGFCVERRIVIPLDTNDTKGEWIDYEVDLTKVSNWKDTITDLRLDPFSAEGEMEFEYIKFEKP